MRVGIVGLILSLLFLVSSSNAALMHVVAGNHEVGIGAGQVFDIMVDGDGRVAGLDLVVCIGRRIAECSAEDHDCGHHRKQTRSSVRAIRARTAMLRDLISVFPEHTTR